MGLQAVPGFIGVTGYNHPAELFRAQQAAITGRRTGAYRYNDFALTPSASAMQMTIAAGDANVMGSEAATTQGGYYVWSNAPETIAWPAAAGSPRYDSLICRVVDTQYGSDASAPQAFWDVVSGAASGSPSPVTDADLNEGGALHRHGAWWRVADVLVPASATNLSGATVTNRRRYARLSRHAMGLTADLPSDPGMGDRYTYVDGARQGETWAYNGTIWVPDGVGAWQNWTPIVRNNASSGTPATVASTVDHARYKKVGDMVFWQMAINVTAAASNGGSVSMPLASASTRSHAAGTLWNMGSGVSTDQCGIAYMGGAPGVSSGPWDRLFVVSLGTGLRDFPAGTVLRGSGFYYVDM